MKKGLFLILLALSQVAAWGIRIIHQPYLQNVGTGEATIVWVADKTSVGWVELAPDDGTNFYCVERPRYWDSHDGIKTEDTVHAVRLIGLRPGTRYRYRVYAQEVLRHHYWQVTYGNIAATDVYSRRPLEFKTFPLEQQAVNFCIVNDIHADNAKLRTLLTQRTDLKEQDFVVFNGDMVSSFNSEKQIFEGFMDTATGLFASELPMFYTRGNHETRGTFAPRFHRYFSPFQSNLYFTMRVGPVFFVILDTGEDKPDTDLEYAGITDYDRYRTVQAQWLEKVVESSKYREAPYRIVIAHIPPTMQGDWHGNIEVRQKFVSLLSKGVKPDVMFCGHTHRFTHLNPSDSIPFPCIVNSNKAVVKVKANEKNISVTITDVDGKTDDQFSLRRKN